MRIDSINDLPDGIREQVAKQMCKPAKTAKPQKYGAVKTECRGIKFDSKKEAERYEQLVALQTAGAIEGLKLQETFVLYRAYTTPEGERVRAISYVADFSYTRDGKRVVEDVKGYRGGSAYRMFVTKKKLMREVHGIEVKEV